MTPYPATLLKIDYRARKSNPTNVLSRHPDYEKIAGVLCATTILTARCNAMQLCQQLYVAAVVNKEPYQEVLLDNL